MTSLSGLMPHGQPLRKPSSSIKGKGWDLASHGRCPCQPSSSSASCLQTLGISERKLSPRMPWAKPPVLQLFCSSLRGRRATQRPWKWEQLGKRLNQGMCREYAMPHRAGGRGRGRLTPLCLFLQVMGRISKLICSA